MPKKKPNLKEIETRIDTTLPYAYYEQHYRALREIELENEWYATKEGQDEVGAEVAEKRINENNKKVEVIKQRLAFVVNKINAKKF